MTSDVATPVDLSIHVVMIMVRITNSTDRGHEQQAIRAWYAKAVLACPWYTLANLGKNSKQGVSCRIT